MEYFLDSANIESIKYINDCYPITGVTTNPIIVAREEREFLPLMQEIRALIGADKKLFIQVTAEEAQLMLTEALTIQTAIGGTLCIKVPITVQGLKAISMITAAGLPVTATAVYTPQQALLAAKAGASYVAPYISHLDNAALDGPCIAGEMASLLKNHCPQCKVLGASFRIASQVNRVIEQGAEAVTITAEMFDTLLENRGTAAELEAFQAKWQAVYGNHTILDFIK